MKTFLSSLFKKKKTNQSIGMDAPKTAIYQILLPWVNEVGPLPASLIEKVNNLAIDDTEDNKNQIRWAAGALDGVLAHHLLQESEADINDIYLLLKNAIGKNDQTSIDALYEYVKKNSPIQYIDDLIHLIVDRQDLDPEKLSKLTMHLLKSSHDINMLKLAIALSAFFPSDERCRILLCLAAHDELTLYSLIAISSMLDSPEEYEKLWLQIAKRVEGWGRVHCIERLPSDPSEALRDWLLLHGYQNNILLNYTAWHCADAGRLADKLETSTNPALIVAATDIIQALLNDGPARGMQDYEDASRCSFHYLRQILQNGFQLAYYTTIIDILLFFKENEADYEHSQEIINLANEILDNPIWEDIIQKGFDTDDMSIFYQAIHAAKAQQINIFSQIYQKQQQNPESHLWYELMLEEDRHNIQLVMELAEQQLPLEAIASGPEDNWGLGLEYQNHNQLGIILQSLNKFPHLGLNLIKSGLQSPVTSNRSHALKALSTWDRQSWPVDLENFVIQCHDREPTADIKEWFDALLKGKTLQDDFDDSIE